MSDLIRRADAIEAVENNSYGMGSRASVEAIKALPSAEASQNLAEPNKELKGSDLIRREDAIHILACEMYAEAQAEGYEVGSVEDYIPEAKAWMSDAPSAEPKIGEWLEVEVFPEVYDIEGVKSWGSEMQCDQCGFRFTAIEGHIRQYNYCPNCGARMNGGEEE